jgi:hypothetical protein
MYRGKRRCSWAEGILINGPGMISQQRIMQNKNNESI